MSARVKIVSGGQTGVDQAALRFALDHGVPCGGWCPRERRSEAGPIPAEFPLQETPSRDYRQRTRWNVRDADVTLIFSAGPTLTGGSALTRELAERLGKPWLLLHGPVADCVHRLRAFRAARPAAVTWNVAGPRESQEPGLGAKVHAVLAAVLGDGEHEAPDGAAS